MSGGVLRHCSVCWGNCLGRWVDEVGVLIARSNAEVVMSPPMSAVGSRQPRRDHGSEHHFLHSSFTWAVASSPIILSDQWSKQYVFLENETALLRATLSIGIRRNSVERSTRETLPDTCKNDPLIAHFRATQRVRSFRLQPGLCMDQGLWQSVEDYKEFQVVWPCARKRLQAL